MSRTAEMWAWAPEALVILGRFVVTVGMFGLLLVMGVLLIRRAVT